MSVLPPDTGALRACSFCVDFMPHDSLLIIC